MTTADEDHSSSQPAVVVLGSLHYDIMVEATHRPIKGETVTGDCWYPKFGGKGGNQAVAAKLHGVETRLISATGTDNFSDYLRARLEDAGISGEYIAQLDQVETGMSVAIQDAEGDYGAVIVSGANLAIPSDLLEHAALWKNAALLLLQNEVPESLNILAANKARSLGLPVCINAAPARDMSSELLSLIDVLIVNAVEAEALGSNAVNSLDTASLAAMKLSRRFPTVIVTAGGDGVAACSTHGDEIKLPAKPITVSSTHGAGDVFTGVFCAEIANKTSLDVAIEIANDRAADHVAASQV